MWGARILMMMLLFNFFTVMFGYQHNSLLDKFMIIDTNKNNVIVSPELKNAISSDLLNQSSSVSTDLFSTISPLSYVWNFLVLLFGTILAPFTIFGYGLPLIYSVPIFIVWFVMYLFAILSLLRGVSF